MLVQLKQFTFYRCTNRLANFCAYAEPTADGKQQVFTSFDPVDGKGKELLRIPLQSGTPGGVYGWDICPDGSEIAIYEHATDGERITFIPLHGGQRRTITAKGYFGLNAIDWAADSKSLFLGARSPGGGTLLRIDTKGNVNPLWHLQSNGTWGVPSPDGKHLAVLGESATYNAWIIDNF